MQASSLREGVVDAYPARRHASSQAAGASYFRTPARSLALGGAVALGKGMGMLGMRARAGLVGLVASIAAAGPAQAIQFTPTAGARVHTATSGQPGVEYNTSGVGVGGQISYDSGTQTLTVTGVVDVINYFDPGNGACPTDVGSNCGFNTAPDLDLVVEAVLVNLDVQFLGFGFYNIVANFATTPDSVADVIWSDPSDSNAVVLEADWAAGTYDDGFGPTTTTGLTATVLYDSVNGTATLDLADTRGFLSVDLASAYASLFDNGDGNYFALDIGSAADFSDGLGGNLDDIVTEAFLNGELPDFTAEINAQLFRVESGSFEVPEPASGLLLAAGIALLAGGRRR